MSEVIDRLNAALQGRYTFERELGEGGMATVYLADDMRHERKVAIKVLKPELAAVVGADRFLTEIKTTANLQHPHILPLHDSGEADGFLFFVMPYIDGETLRDRLDREKQLPVDEAVGVATAIASALSAAHEQGVVHRDMKPANILLSRGEPLVADFGIALAVSEAGGNRLTETGLSVGTPFYMSPEQATGDREIGIQSDVYALGCVLYEMLVGEPPYVGNTAQAVLGKILTEKPRAPTAARPAIPANIEGAILKALEKLPADRFTSANELVRALADTSFRYGEAAEADTAAGDTSPGLWKPWAIAATVAAVALGGAAFSGVGRTDTQTTVHFAATLPPDMQIRTDQGVNLDVAPDGTQIVFAAADGSGADQLWLRRFDQMEPTPIGGSEGARNPRFSPDGSAVAFSADGALTTVSLGGAPPLTLISSTELVASGGGGVAWGRDGYIYFRKSGGGMWRVPENGGPDEELTQVEEGSHSWFDVLPNGNGVLLSITTPGGPAESEIAVFSFKTRELTPLLTGAMARFSESGHIVYADATGALLAAPFDAGSMRTTGPARPLLEGIQVNTGSASYFGISDNGTLTYLPGVAAGGGRPTWVREDGSSEMLDASLPTGAYGGPAISPDGDRIAFHYASSGAAFNVWVYDIAARTFSPLTFDGTSVWPFWKPDATEIGYSSGRDGSELSLHASRADFSGEPRALARRSREGTWTSDGRIIHRDAAGRVVAESENGGDSVIVVDGEFVDAFTVSPDGEWMAYGSPVSGRPEIYVVPIPGPGGRRQVSIEGGSDAVWSRDGSEIFYRTLGNSWMVATVRTDPDFAVEGRRSFADQTRFADQYDVSTDGSSVIAIELGMPGGNLSAPVVITNWFEVLREQVGR